MAWLLRDGEVLATVEVADTLSSRLMGLVGREQIVGGLLLRPGRWTHTVGLDFPVDVAYCDLSMVVVETRRMPPWRVGVPRLRAGCIVEAPAGAFERWRLVPGDQLELKD